MKLTHLLVLMALGVAAMQSHAEIYKWKDKDGTMRYSDTLPPANIKHEVIGSKRAIKPAGEQTSVANEPAVPAKNTKQEAVNNEDDAAKKRQVDAETEKKTKLEKEKHAAVKAENCKTAKGTLASYTQGGRIYKMNEKGEREYVSDAGLAEGKAQAQRDIEEYCN